MEPQQEQTDQGRLSLWGRAGAFFRRRITAGLVFILPFVLTIWVVVTLFRFADGILGRYLNQLLRDTGVIEHSIPSMGLIALVLLLMATGFFATSKLGQKITSPLERFLLSLPFVKSVYGGTKQILQAFMLTGKGGAFQKVALLEYPREGMFAIGFVTGRIDRQFNTKRGVVNDVYTIFVPTTPNPTSGFLILSAVDETHLLDITVEEGVKIILSGGFVQADLDMIGQSTISESDTPAGASSLPGAGE